MDDKFLQQAIAEVIEAQGIALGLVVSALAAQMDAGRLATALQQRLSAAKSQPAFSDVAAHLTTHALEAALSVSAQQRKAKH